MAVTKAKKGDYVVARKLVFAGTYIPVEWRRSKEKDQECYVVMRALRVDRNGLVKHVANKQAWEAKHTGRWEHTKGPAYQHDMDIGDVCQMPSP